MSKIRVELDVPVVNGKQVSFFSPLGSTDARSIMIHDVEYALVDSHGKELAKLDYSWTAGALVSVILDTSTNKAYVQNATSNAYIEDTFLRKDAKPEDIDAADRIHGHKLTDSNITGTLAISKGGTGATTVAGARNKLGLGNTDGAVPIANGGTNATNVENARKNFSFLGGSQIPENSSGYYTDDSVNPYWYRGTGDAGSGSQMYNYDTNARGSNIIFIVGTDVRGFLTPWGGIMFSAVGALGGANYELFGVNSGQKAYYADGRIMLRTSSDYINKSGALYYYWCL